mmetsp:Transcript_33180/g.78698  ORF Transcript_33180/g.78698 Transcript_33180/m.78698 type:complete len:206 (-) Transcript_33180:161-778(-)
MTGVKHHRQENRFRNRNNLMFQFSASVLLIFLIVDSNTESIESGLDKVAPSGVSLDGEPVSDTRAQEVAQFAIGELRGVCRYCDDAYRAGYEAMTLKQLWSAEAKNLTVPLPPSPATTSRQRSFPQADQLSRSYCSCTPTSFLESSSGSEGQNVHPERHAADASAREGPLGGLHGARGFPDGGRGICGGFHAEIPFHGQLDCPAR